MCGVFTNRQAGIGPLEWNAIAPEWNGMCDPHAAAIVYRATTNIHRSIGLDVTRQVTMNVKQVREKFNCDRLRPVLDFAEIWFRQRNEITFNDPLAAATIFDDQICVFKKGTVDIELTSERLKGLTLWKPSDSERHEVALEVDSKRFFEHYFSVFQ